MQRIRIDDIKNDDWFMRNYVPSRYVENEDVNLDDVYAVFDDPEVRFSQWFSMLSFLLLFLFFINQPLVTVFIFY